VVGKEEIFLDGSLCCLLKGDKSLRDLLKPWDETSASIPLDKLRTDKAEKWMNRYQELVQHKKQHGHCNVPYRWPGGAALAQWVKRQRHQFKLKQEGRHSNLTDDRLALLQELDFVWDSRAAAWEERFENLKLFKREFGHCKVTRKHTAYLMLVAWLKRQRRQCRLSLTHSPKTSITPDQCRRLLDLGLLLNN